MSKSTKVIAALGVVAGLGVAALPAFTYAASTSGAVKLEAEVTSGIAITIHSNGDAKDTTYYDADPTNAGNMGDPKVNTNTKYVKAEDLFTNWSSAKTSLSQNDKKEDATSTVTVYTNSNGGYTLTVNDEDEVNALKSGDDSIAAMSESNAIDAGNAAWGLKVDGDHAVAAAKSYNAVPVKSADGLKIAEASQKTTGGTATTVTYGVSTAADQPTGTYSDVIVFTATTK